MLLLSRAKELLVDFIFPKNSRILELEALSADKILDTLPLSQKFGDKNILAIFDYSYPLTKEIIWELKYKGNASLADKLSSILYDVIRQELGDMALFESSLWQSMQPILLVPIPISDKRRLERGWNQAELLAEKVAARDTEKIFKYMPGQLIKNVHTESQVKTSSKSERLKNVANSMKVLHSPIFANKCIILIDDVVTTGSTFIEAERALLSVGAKKILCIALAH